MKRQNQRGVTMIESLVAVAIFSFMIAGLYTTLLAGNASWMMYESNVGAQQEVRKTMAYMTRDLRIAESILISQDTSSMNMSFSQPGVGNVAYAWANSGSNANNIIRQTPTTTRTVARNVTALSITDLGNDISIDVTSNVPNAQGGAGSNFQLDTKVAKR